MLKSGGRPTVIKGGRPNVMKTIEMRGDTLTGYIVYLKGLFKTINENRVDENNVSDWPRKQCTSAPSGIGFAVQ